MELPSSDEVHRLTVQEFDTSKLLAHGSRQARQRKYSEFLIVDIDSHHYETDHLSEIYEYIEEPVIRQLGKTFHQTMGLPIFPQRRSDQVPVQQCTTPLRLAPQRSQACAHCVNLSACVALRPRHALMPGQAA